MISLTGAFSRCQSLLPTRYQTQTIGLRSLGTGVGTWFSYRYIAWFQEPPSSRNLIIHAVIRAAGFIIQQLANAFVFRCIHGYYIPPLALDNREWGPSLGDDLRDDLGDDTIKNLSNRKTLGMPLPTFSIQNFPLQAIRRVYDNKADWIDDFDPRDLFLLNKEKDKLCLTGEEKNTLAIKCMYRPLQEIQELVYMILSSFVLDFYLIPKLNECLSNRIVVSENFSNVQNCLLICARFYESLSLTPFLSQYLRKCIT